MQEQRKYCRIPLTSTVRIIYSDNIPLYTTSININRGGIGLYSSSIINEGVIVRLDIMFKDIRSKEIMEVVEGKIVFNYKWHWVYVLGIEFDRLLNHENTPCLLEYIENCERMLRF